ncbi:MAG: glyoxalase [Candidatus Dadabacteria bacterium]|nr:glyoxalase [Candidatus Dadabacteria bacterium]NIQ14421.1 glyoxalase [Candidatus Dadabacteria bacterium]
MNLTPFHIAIQVRDIKEARKFYGETLGFKEGRSDDIWVDYNMFGHQFVCHLNPDLGKDGKVSLHYNKVDEHAVPVPHAGVVLELDDWNKFSERLKSKGIEFIIKPYTRFKGQPGEQSTMFFLDPSGNALEFKAFRDIEEELFRK